MSSIEKSDERYLVIIFRTTESQGRWWKVLRWVERIALAGGLGLLAIVGVSRLERAVVSQAALKAFANADSTASSTVDSSEAVESLHGEDVQRLTDDVIPAQIKEISTGSGTPLAVLEIPKIHLEVPVLNGTDALTLNHAVGRIAGTARLGEPGNIGIAGHRDTFFRGLKEVRKGDVIELKTREGKDRYIVDEIQIVAPDDVGVLRPRLSPSITLVTCYPFYFVGNAPQRYIVMASLIGEQRSGPVQ